MKRFLAVVALFLAPVILVCGVFGLAVYTSGEWRTEEEVAQMVLDGEPAFLGLAYRDNTRYYKHLVASGKGADLLMLGTSRSMQFHSEFFTTDSFYNAGGGSGYINEFQYFLENLPEESLPDTLIMVMDQYFFNQAWVGTGGMPEAFDYGHYEFSAKTALSEAMRGWAAGKYSLLDVFISHPDVYGMAAVGRGSGFNPDGSYCYGRLLDHPEEGTDVGFHDTYDRILKGTNRFEYGEYVYPTSTEVVQRLLAWCNDRDIQVVLIIPPYAPSVYERMAESGNYGYFDWIPKILTELCEPYGYEVYDFSYMPDTSDDEYIDGYHGGDRVYARLTRQLAEQSTILEGLIDTDYLDAALADSGNPLRLAQ